MNDCVKKVQIDNTIYYANVDFRNAIKCNEIAEDNSIDDTERSLGIICTIFGEDGLNNKDHYEKLLNWILKYLSYGEENTKKTEEPDMDYVQDYKYIWTSIYSEYNGLDINKEKVEWHRFLDLLNGLSNSDFGNCCILNRIRNIRNLDLKEITDKKERDKIIKAKKQVELKKRNKKHTKEQEENVKKLFEILNL